MTSTFRDLGASAEITSLLARQHIDDPTPIQLETVPAALQGRDVSGRAPTGSGKTLAFAIPVTQRVGQAAPRKPRALVLTPTRELAAQIEREFRPLLKTRQRFVASFYGGVGFGQQLKALRRGVDVAVACPGRLADLVNQREIDLSDVDIVVIDEADRMADMGFLPEVRRLLDQVQPDRQTLLFSATLDGDVDVLVKHYQRNPHVADVAPPEAEVDLTSHKFMAVDRERRTEVTAGLIADHGPTVVFCRTRHGADRLAKRLAKTGTNAVAIHGGRSQSQRDRALKSFSEGQSAALIATDVAARGIHVDDVACVIHYDLPGDHKDYVHRSGRTGRAGASGAVVTLVSDSDRSDARKLQRDLGMDDRTSAIPGSHRPTSRPDTKRRDTKRAEPRRQQGKNSSQSRKRKGGPKHGKPGANGQRRHGGKGGQDVRPAANGQGKRKRSRNRSPRPAR